MRASEGLTGFLLHQFCVPWAVLTITVAVGAQALELTSNVIATGQVRVGDQSRSTEAPVNVYGAIRAADFQYPFAGETYFRLAGDWTRADSAADFYLGFARLPWKGAELFLGRQVLADVPGAMYVADAGRVHVQVGGPWAFSLYGGQPRYFEPLSGPALVSQDEQLFGGSVHWRRTQGTQLTVSFLQLQRLGRRVSQLTGAQWYKTLRGTPGRPQLYALIAYDTAEQNLQQVVAGAGFAAHRRVFVRVETAYETPTERTGDGLGGLHRFPDPLVSVFVAGKFRVARCGLQYQWQRHLSAYLDYAFQTFDELPGQAVDAHRAHLGVLWLPGGDGLELVRAELSVTDSRGGRLHAVRAYYENRVYARILLRTKLEVAQFDKVTNEQDIAVSGRAGIAFEVTPGLLAEIHVEGNRSPRFDREFRLGFFVTYNLRYQEGWQPASSDPRPARLPGGWAG